MAGAGGGGLRGEYFICLFLVGCQFRLTGLKQFPSPGSTASAPCCPGVTDELVYSVCTQSVVVTTVVSSLHCMSRQHRKWRPAASRELRPAGGYSVRCGVRTPPAGPRRISHGGHGGQAVLTEDRLKEPASPRPRRRRFGVADVLGVRLDGRKSGRRCLRSSISYRRAVVGDTL